jgi:5-methyltetrahydrofolate--homocysteine methyltransferase
MEQVVTANIGASYLDELRRRVLVFDGAMGTSIQSYNLSPEDFGGKAGCNDFLVLSKPDVVEDIHSGFLAAGADVVETCTFQATRRRLAEWGLADRTFELNFEAAKLARRAANRLGGRFVAGALGPTGMLPSSSDPALSAITFAELRELFREQAAALLAGGVDLLLLETAQDLLELKAALFGIRDAQAGSSRRVPVQAQITLDVTGRMLLGTDVSGSLATLEALPCDVIGLNCSTGPEHMREPIRYLCQHSSKPVSCIPNAGLPVNDGSGEAVYGGLPHAARTDGRAAPPVRGGLRRTCYRRLLRHHPGPHPSLRPGNPRHNPRPETRNPKLETRNPKSRTPHRQRRPRRVAVAGAATADHRRASEYARQP